MKNIDFDYFGENQYIYFNIQRLMEIERITGKSTGDIIKNQDLNFNILTVLLSVGLKHHGIKNPQWYAEKLQVLLDNGMNIEELSIGVVKALIGSGIIGKAAYYSAFPEEKTKAKEKELEEFEKN